MFGTLQYASGYTSVEYAPCDNNCTEVREDSTTYLAQVTTTTVTTTYTGFEETLVGSVKINWIAGFLLCVIGAFGFADVLFNLRGMK